MSKYSITRLLVLKKSLESEIKTLLASHETKISVVVVKANTEKSNKDKIRTSQQALLDSLTSAIKKYSIVSSAIAVSNANTKVFINGETMSVTEAIARKNNINMEKELVNLISKAVTRNNKVIEDANKEMDKEINSRAQTLIGREKAVTDDILQLVTKSVKDGMAVEVIEPTDLLTLITVQRERIQKFMEEVDITLNEINATTMVELSLLV